MSEVKIQSTPAVPEGAQANVLSPDGEQKSRSGFVGSQQFPLTGRPGAEVNLGSTPAPVSPNSANGAASRPRESVSGMGVGGRDVAVRPVDSKTVEGSYPGDHRATAKPAVLPDNPAVRQPMTQAKLNSKLDAMDKSAFQSFGEAND